MARVSMNLTGSEKAGVKKPVVTFISKSNKFTFMDRLKSSNETDINVKQDLPPDVRETRRKLSRFYEYAIKQGKTAKVVWDKLIVNGVAYQYDQDSNSPIEILTKRT